MAAALRNTLVVSALSRRPVALGLLVCATLALADTSTQRADAAAVPIISWEYDQVDPAIAYNSQTDQYLVVWEDHHWGFGTDWDIYGQRVAADGSTVGGGLGISYEGSNHRLAPDVAYNPVLNEFLVVWEYEFSATDHDIYGQRVASDGTLIGGQIGIATPTDLDSHPAIAFNAADEEYLVVWERRVGSDEFAQHDLYGQRLSITGTLQGGAIAIATGLTDDSAPAVAHGSASNQYLVVWQENIGGDYDIKGQRISGNGSLVGGVITLCGVSYDQVKPRLAFNDSANGFLAVWEDHRAAGWYIYGQRVNADGALAGGNFAISGDGTKSRLNPDVAYKAAIREYLVAFEYEYSASDHDVYRRRVASDATLPDSDAAVSAASSNEGRPSVAADKGQGYLVAWEDGRNSATMGVDIYGDIVRVPVFSGFVLFNFGTVPLNGVTVELYCSSDSVNLGSLIASTTTGSDGWFGLTALGTCGYYNVRETDRPGFTSLSATTVGGAAVNQNWVQYVYPLEGKTLTGNVFRDTNPVPTAAITSPSRGAVITGLVPVTGTANDTDLGLWVLDYGAGTDPVAFVNIGTGNTPVISGALGNWDTSVLPDGTYTLRLRAADAINQTAVTSVSVVLDATPPTSVITSPSSGAVVNGQLAVTGTALDAHLDSWILDYGAGERPSAWVTIASGSTAVVSGLLGTWNTVGLPDGTYSLRLRVTDQASHTSRYTVGVILQVPTASPTRTATATPTFSRTPTCTATYTATPAPTATRTPTPTFTATSTATATPTRTPTPTTTATATYTATPTPSATRTPTLTFTATFTATATSTRTPTPTPTPTATYTATPPPSVTPTPTPTFTTTFTATATLTPSSTRTATATATYTATPPPSATPTPTPTFTATCTATATPTPTSTRTATATTTYTATPTPSATAATPTPTFTTTFTATATSTRTPTGTSIPTTSYTPTPTASATGTLTPRFTATSTATTTATRMPVATSTATPTASATRTPAPTLTATSLATATRTPTPTPTLPHTPTPAPSATSTPTPTSTAAPPAAICTLEDVSPDLGSTHYQAPHEPEFSSLWGKMLSLGATGIPGAVGPATSWNSLNGDVLVEHLAAADQDGHLILLYYYAGADWKAVDITEKTGAKIAIERPQSWLSYEGSVVFERLAAPAPNGDLLVFSWHSGSDWEVMNVSAATGYKITGPVASWITASDGVPVEHLAARATNDDLLVFFRWAGGAWGVADVTSITGQKVGGEPEGWKVIASGSETAEKVAIPAGDGSLLLFTYLPSTDWQVINLTTLTGQSVASPADVWFDPIALYEKLAARAPNGDLVIFYYDQIDLTWQVTNVTAVTGQSIGGPVAGWRTKSSTTVWWEHIAAAGPNQHVYVFYKPTGGTWGVVDVTNLTGTTITQRPTAWVAPAATFDFERVAAPSFDGRLYVFSFDPSSDWSVVNASVKAQGRTLYAAAPQAGVWKSLDYGNTWSQPTRPQPPQGEEATGTLDAPVVIDLAVSPTDPRIVFAATGDDHRTPSRTGVYRSTDAGATWSLVHQFYCGTDVQPVTQLLLAPGQASTVYAAGGCAIGMNTNNGAPGSWTEVVPPGIDGSRRVWHVAVSAELPGEVRRAFACGDGTLWYSHDSGLHWFEDTGTAGILPGGFCGASGTRGHIPGPQALAIDPTNPQRVYLAHPDHANGPSYFVHSNNPPDPVDGTHCNDTSANPFRGCGEGSLWYGDLTTFNPSNPGALSGAWSQLPGPPVYWNAGDSGSAFVQTHATANGYLVFFADKGTLHVSVGKPTGLGWHRLDGWDASRSYREQLPQNVSLVHADPHGLYVSPDADLTLTPGPHHGSVYAYNAELDKCLGGRLWYANDGGVYRTDDCGQTWINTLTGLHTLAAVNVAADVEASNDPGEPNPPPALYFGTGDNDAFYSLDGGATYQPPYEECGDCDAWFADPGQRDRVFRLSPRGLKGNQIVGAFDVFLNAAGHPDAKNQPTYRVYYDTGIVDFAVSWAVAAGYRPVIPTLSGETPLANGDYITIRQIGSTRRVLLRARDSFNTASPWAQEKTDLPNTARVVQAAGGHTSPTYYVGDGTRLWRSHRAGNGDVDRWDPIVPGGGATVASRFFVNPYDANEIYIIDNNAIRHTTNGTQAAVAWAIDPLLGAAVNPGGEFSYDCPYTDRNIELPARCVLNDMVFDREAPQTRFAVGIAGVFYSGDGVNWFRLLETRAMPSRPRAAWFDRYTDPNDRSLYIALDGRGLMRCQPIPAVAPSPIPTATLTPTPTRTSLATCTATPTYTALPTPTPTPIGPPIPTPTFTPPPTPTFTRIATKTVTPTPTPTVTPPPKEWMFRGVVLGPKDGRKRLLRGVRVSLYRSVDSMELGERLASSVTGADGAFSMRVLNEPNAGVVYYFLALDDPNYAIADIIPGPNAERADQWIRYTKPAPGEHSENQIEVRDSGLAPVATLPDIVAVWNGPAVFIQPAGPINAGGSPLDLYVQGVEITQATQCFAPGAGFTSCSDNSLPLASGRATAVRVYIGHQGGPVANCAASPPSQILLEKVPVALTWFTPLSVSGVPGGVGLWGGPSAVQYVDVRCATKLDDPADPAGSLRANTWGSATFIIPNPAGDALVVRATVNDDPTKYLESDYTNNSSGFLSAPLEARQPWKVKWALIDYQPWASKFYPPYTGPRFADAGVVGGVSDLMKDMYPMPVEYSQSATIQHLGPDARDDQDFLLYSLAFIQMFMSSQPDSLFGWLPRGAEDDAASTPLLLGYAQIGGAAGFGVDHRNAAGLPDKMDQALAHEVGHNRGLRHIDTGKELCWPFGTDASIRETGFTVTSQSVLRADQHDLMHSQQLAWLSPYTWMRLAGKPYSKAWAKVGAGCATSAYGNALPVQVNMSQAVMLVHGTVYRDGSATIESPFITAGSPTPDVSAEAPYCLELQSDDGAVLASHCFDLPFVNVETEAPTDAASFAAALPFDDAAAWLVLRYGPTLLAARGRSIRPPELQVLSVDPGPPASHSLSLTWAATSGDQDNNPLRYAVLYSPDAGTSWTPVAVDLDASGIDLDTSSWAGSDQAQVRVLVSDGFLTSAGDSYLFSVPRKPPAVWITTPAGGAVVQPLAALVLTGHASDLEDGELSGASLVWTLDGNRMLGNGSQLFLPGLNTEPGAHEVALTVTDHDGMQSSAHVQVTVTALPSCVGDCNEDDSVTVGEIVRGVNIALGTADMSECPLADSSGEGQVTIDELIQAVSAALSGCVRVP